MPELSKDSVNTAAKMSALIGDIFDLTQATYNVVAKAYAFQAATGDVVVTSKNFNDRLNFSAMIIDYGLAEIFGVILATTKTLQSAAISLSSTGLIVLKGEGINEAKVKSTDVSTLTPSLTESFYNVEIAGAGLEMLASLVNMSVDIATTSEKTTRKEVL
jgi:hypothetical protein